MEICSGAYLYGEAVLGMLGLCPTNPAYLHVATPARVRRSLPEYIRVVRTPGVSAGVVYDGVPCQRATDAVRSAKGHMLPDRLAAAVARGREEGYITKAEADALEIELGVRA